MEYAQPKLVTD